jgi:hypothetical protein
MRAQFSLRTLLLAITVVSIHAAAYRASEKWGEEAIGRSFMAAAVLYVATRLRDRAAQGKIRSGPLGRFFLGYLMLFGYMQAVLGLASVVLCFFQH